MVKTRQATRIPAKRYRRGLSSSDSQRGRVNNLPKRKLWPPPSATPAPVLNSIPGFDQLPVELKLSIFKSLTSTVSPLDGSKTCHVAEPPEVPAQSASSASISSAEAGFARLSACTDFAEACPALEVWCIRHATPIDATAQQLQAVLDMQGYPLLTGCSAELSLPTSVLDDDAFDHLGPFILHCLHPAELRQLRFAGASRLFGSSLAPFAGRLQYFTRLTHLHLDGCQGTPGFHLAELSDPQAPLKYVHLDLHQYDVLSESLFRYHATYQSTLEHVTFLCCVGD
ncbi:hypothetical protein JCM11641_006328 [Rhodosporidiobolus odoratus]